MAEPDPHPKAAYIHAMGQAPLAAALGFETLEVGDGRASMRAPWREEMVGDTASGVIAGGLVTSLIDHVCGAAVMSAKAGAPGAIATLDLRIDYLRPAGARLGVTATAHCYRVTRSIAFVRAEAHDGQGDTPVATAQAAFMLGTAGPAMGGAA